MAHYYETALGRMVPEHEWVTVKQDIVLKVLYDFRTSPFNPGNTAMTRIALGNAANLSPADTEAAAESLISDGLVESLAGSEPSYRITGKGVVFVRSSSHRLSGCS